MNLKNRLGIFILLFFCYTEGYSQGSKTFNGLNIGVHNGSQYIFGGAQIDNIETIGQGNKWVTGINIGIRKHINSKVVIGLDARINQPFGNFSNTENPDGTIVTYEIRHQTAFEINLGRSFGSQSRNLIYGYFGPNQTRFDIDIDRTRGDFSQTDIENFGRIGVGYERVITKNWSVRGSIGTSMDSLEGTENGVDLVFYLLYSI